jgi:hypothetical protein
MTTTAPARPARSTLLLIAAVAVAAVAGALGLRSWTAPTPSAAPAAPTTSSAATRRHPPPRAEGRPGALGAADGVVAGRVTVFDDEVPAVAHLDPDLLDALRRAATDAARDRVEFSVSSGWRSPEYQEHLLREAVAKYGSEKAAARWVSTPQNSRHVSGEAIDIGTRAAAWLSRRGAGYGLCQVYRNEPWHYELRPDAAADGCPPPYADPTEDPRMSQ